MRDKFEADEDWYWCCCVDRSDGTCISAVACRYNGGNKIYFRVGDCYFDLWK